MDTFLEYVEALERSIADGIDSDRDSELLLPVAPMVALRRARPIELLRAQGSFFTGAALAAKLWANVLDELDRESRVFDPAVGAGDLLLPAARRLAELDSEGYPAQLGGIDVDESFVRAAQLRLALLSDGRVQPNEFEAIRAADFLDDFPCELASSTHVVMNPPFNPVSATSAKTGAVGNVNAAAIFVERSLAGMKEGSRLLAILPEVLRSGSRYAGWRERIASMCSDLRVELSGQFDAHTDVHVFLLSATRREQSEQSWPGPATSSHTTVGDYFEVRVGAVVPHRHAETGPSVPYLTTGDAPVAASIETPPTVRAFSGRLDRGPFVVLRRTSRPGDRRRAKATLYRGTEEIAVENHLLVVRPRSGALADCEQAMEVFEDEATSHYLDETIRLRHLTVSAVGSIPWRD